MGARPLSGPDALPGPGPIATEDARPTDSESQGFLRTVMRTTVGRLQPVLSRPAHERARAPRPRPRTLNARGPENCSGVRACPPCGAIDVDRGRQGVAYGYAHGLRMTATDFVPCSAREASHWVAGGPENGTIANARDLPRAYHSVIGYEIEVPRRTDRCDRHHGPLDGAIGRLASYRRDQIGWVQRETSASCPRVSDLLRLSLRDRAVVSSDGQEAGAAARSLLYSASWRAPTNSHIPTI